MPDYPCCCLLCYCPRHAQSDRPVLVCSLSWPLNTVPSEQPWSPNRQQRPTITSKGHLLVHNPLSLHLDISVRQVEALSASRTCEVLNEIGNSLVLVLYMHVIAELELREADMEPLNSGHMLLWTHCDEPLEGRIKA